MPLPNFTNLIEILFLKVVDNEGKCIRSKMTFQPSHSIQDDKISLSSLYL